MANWRKVAASRRHNKAERYKTAPTCERERSHRKRGRWEEVVHTHTGENGRTRGGVRSGDACFENSLLRALGRVGRARQALTSSKNVVVSHRKTIHSHLVGKKSTPEERRKTFAAFCYPGIKCVHLDDCVSCFHGFFFVSRVCVCVCGRRWLCVVILERPCCRAISNCTTIPQPRRLTS